MLLSAAALENTAYASCTLPSDHSQYINIVACGASTSPTFDNQTAINAALTAAYAAGVAANQYPGIFVPPGVYYTSGKHDPQTGIGIYGTGTLKLTASSSNAIVDTSNSGNTIAGLTFDLSANTGASRVAVNIDGGSVGTVVSNTTVLNGRIDALVTNGGGAPTQITIKDNMLTSAKIGGTSGGAIDIDSGTSHFSIVENKINGNWSGPNPGDGAGIAIASGSSYGQISSNDIYANVGNGIFLESGQYISIGENTISDNQYPGIYLYPTATAQGRVSITGNVITGNNNDGITVGSDTSTWSYVEIVGNHIESNGSAATGGDGINIDGTANVVVSANTIFNNALVGILLYGSENISLTGNIVSNNSQASSSSCSSYLSTACPGILVYGSSNNTVNGNISTNNGGGASQGYGVEEADCGSSTNYNTYAGNNARNNALGEYYFCGANDTTSANQ